MKLELFIPRIRPEVVNIMESKRPAPAQLGAFSLKSRVAMAPLTRCRVDNPEATPTELMARYRAQLIILEGGKLFIANPDLPERFRRGAPLNAPDLETFYQGGEKGYVNYPVWEARA